MAPPMTDVAIQVSGLRKSYGRTEAVRGIDLRVFKGEVFALLGVYTPPVLDAWYQLYGHQDPSGFYALAGEQ